MSAVTPLTELAGPIIVFHDDADHPILYGHPDTALLHIIGDPSLLDGATIFDAEGRRLSYRREPRKRLRWWHLTGTNMSDFDVASEEPAELRSRLEDALSNVVGNGEGSVTLSELVAEAFSRWMVD